MNLNIDMGMELIYKAVEERDRQKVWEIWLINYQNMDNETFIPFDEFYAKFKQPQIISTKSTEDIIANAEAIRQADQKKGG
jgi:hypothetical protein